MLFSMVSGKDREIGYEVDRSVESKVSKATLGVFGDQRDYGLA